MTIALDPSKDVLVPVRAFKQLASANNFGDYESLAGEVQEHLRLEDDKIESDAKFKFLKKDSDEYKALERGFKQLDDRIRGFPDNQELWLIRCFLAPFEGRITDPAKMIWETLESASGTANLTQVEREAREFQQTRKRNYQALATACQALQTSCSTVSDALAAFTTALTTGGAVPTTTPASGAATTQTQVRESLIVNNLKQEKKLYLAGFNSKSEYMSRLLELKNLLLEDQPTTAPASGAAGAATTGQAAATGQAATTAPAPAVTQDQVQERLKIKTFVDSMSYNLLPAGILATGLQDGLSRINQTLDRLQESLKRLKTTKMLHSKGLISNTEYMATLVEVKKNIEENKKIQLNEFFLITALFAALGAVFGWFTAKWAANRFGAYGSPGDHNSRRGNNQQTRDERQTQQSVTSILAGLGGGLDPEGRVVGVDGRPAPNPSEELAKLKTDMASAKTNLTRLVGEATPLLAASPTQIAQRVAATSNQDQINTTGANLLSTITAQDLVGKITAVENGITTLERTP